jgi:rRNA pseudouridine-1189 N-methylase Emg1 (Nep1/Mra1 family)
MENENEIDDIEYNELTNSKIDKRSNKEKDNKRLIIILEHANLELTNEKKDPEIINSDEHYKVIKKLKKSVEEFRPDITHQVKIIHLI